MGDCSNSPDGFHQVDTSMEEGPNNCFYCGQSMVGYVRPATRPQPSAEPVAWMYAKEGALDEYGQPRVILLDYDTPAAVADGWTETPLYPASALEAARREALEEAAKVADQSEAECNRWQSPCKWTAREIRRAIRALKENTNG